MSPRLPLLIALSTVACVGGGGALSQSLETQDRAPITNEGVSNSTEGYRSSLERTGSSVEMPSTRGEPSPTSKGGGFSCGGTYTCSLNGEKDDDPVVLVPSGDGCSAADGTALQAAGFTATGDGFSSTTTITSKNGQTTTITLVCTKVSSDTVPKKKDEDDAPPTPGSSGSSIPKRDGG